MPDLKKCTKCKTIKEFNCFPKNKGGKDGLSTWCRVCVKEHGRIWRKTEVGARKVRNNHIKKTYKITLEEYESILELQKGVCAICAKPETRKNKWGNISSLAVDHNYKTGHIRGLLCMSCNLAIGMLCTNTGSIDLLLKAINYIQKKDAKCQI